MAEQQPQPMHQEAELIDLFRNVAHDISGVHTTIGTKGVTRLSLNFGPANIALDRVCKFNSM